MSSPKKSRWFAIILLVSLVLIVYTRLTRFEFVWGGRIPLERVTWQPLNMRDVPINVFFFIPLGLGLAGVLARGIRPATLGRRVIALGLLLSLALESAQLFLPDRVPSLADIIANGAGLFIGYGLYLAWGAGIGRVLDRYVTPRTLLAGLLVYGLAVALLTVYLNRSVHLRNWDTSFPLVVGNEAVGGRPWSGRIGDLELASGLVASPEYVARYNLSGEAPFTDIVGNPVPPLQWQEGPATPQTGGGVNVGPGEWLATASGFTGFSEMARRQNAFAIRATVSSFKPNQRGPARIISLSADAERRNITIGQEGSALIVRLRTPSSGENGTKPVLHVPGVFARDSAQAIAVEYDGSRLRVSVEGRPYQISLAPGVALFSGFVTGQIWPINITGDPYRFDKAYWGIVIGLALLLFGGLVLARRLIKPEE